jgi:hypothetical protein
LGSAFGFVFGEVYTHHDLRDIGLEKGGECRNVGPLTYLNKRSIWRYHCTLENAPNPYHLFSTYFVALTTSERLVSVTARTLLHPLLVDFDACLAEAKKIVDAIWDNRGIYLTPNVPKILENGARFQQWQWKRGDQYENESTANSDYRFIHLSCNERIKSDGEIAEVSGIQFRLQYDNFSSVSDLRDPMELDTSGL